MTQGRELNMNSIKAYITLTITTSMLLVSPGVMAQGSSSSGEVSAPKSIEFTEGEEVKGQLINPDDGLIRGEQRGKTISLIKVRQDFIPEILKSTSDVGP
jgi:hypothetical protein